jgi:hypothetical protein
MSQSAVALPPTKVAVAKTPAHQFNRINKLDFRLFLRVPFATIFSN